MDAAGSRARGESRLATDDAGSGRSLHAARYLDRPRSDGIARSLADVLVNTLSLDLIYIRLGVCPASRQWRWCAASTATTPAPDGTTVTFGPLLRPDQSRPHSTSDPFGVATCAIAVCRFGIADNSGVS